MQVLLTNEMLEKKYNTPHGNMDCYKNYLVFYQSADEISAADAKEIISYADAHYGKNPYVFISKRNFASDVEPAAYKAINHKTMVGVAIVSESDAVKQEAYNEQELYEGSFSFFKTVEEAKDWAETVVKRV